jgi:exopolysaccharide transport family protein
MTGASPSVTSAQARPVDPLAILSGLLRRWKLIVAMPLVTLAATYGVLKVVPSVYKSTVEILIFDPQRQIDQAVQKPVSPFRENVDNTAMNTEIQVIKSKSLALRIAKELHLDQDKEFQPQSRLSVWLERLGLGNFRWFADDPQAVQDPEQRLDWAAEAVRRRLDADRVSFSYILTISASSQDAARAHRLAEAAADNYLAGQREARQEALQRVATWLKGRIDDLQSRVLETEAAIEKLKSESGLSDSGGSTVSEQQISEINTQLSLARAEVAEKQVHLDQARRLSENNGELQDIPEIAASPAISQLRQQQAELSWREAELRGKLGDRHAEVIIARMQLAGINKRISAEVEHLLGNMKNAYDISVRREQMLEASLQKLTSARGNSEAYVKLQQLRRIADADRKLYESYLSQYNEISTRQTLQDASARIITPASLPDAPSSPKRVLFYGFGGVLGIGLGVALAFIREYFQSGVRTGSEVEGSFGYPVVGLIPAAKADNPRRRIEHGSLVHDMVDAPRSLFSEAVHSIRIGLKLSNPDRAPKVILITSSIPGEGKSATAALLAASSAASGQRTVLVDCDLRRQSISEAFAENQRGVAEILRGSAHIADVTIKDQATGSHIIPAGSALGNPADLLTSERMHDFIAQLRDDYDYVVLDASPLLPVVDALALANMADKILMIVEWNRTSRDNIADALKMLRPEAHRVAGIVLNKVEFKQLRGYGYGYAYGYPKPYAGGPSRGYFSKG